MYSTPILHCRPQPRDPTTALHFITGYRGLGTTQGLCRTTPDSDQFNTWAWLCCIVTFLYQRQTERVNSEQDKRTISSLFSTQFSGFISFKQPTHYYWSVIIIIVIIRWSGSTVRAACVTRGITSVRPWLVRHFVVLDRMTSSFYML